MDDLVERGVKALVIACNTASSACLRDARERYDVPVVEVILPAVRRAVATTRNGRIGVIGTQATVTSRAYQDAFAAARRHRDHRGGVPALRRLRRARGHQRATGARPGRGVPRAAAAGRRRHPGARLYALPAAVRSDPAGDGRQRHAGVPAEETAKDLLRVLTERDLLRSASRRPPAPAANRLFEATGDPEAFTHTGGPLPGSCHNRGLTCSASRRSAEMNSELFGREIAVMFSSYVLSGMASSDCANHRARLLRQCRRP